jgi:hypothetical protein
MKSFVSVFLAAAVCLGIGLPQAQAAEAKPIAALAVAGYNELINDVNFVGKLIDKPEIGAAAEGFLSLATQGKGLAGIDKERPWGAIVQAKGEQDFSGYLFVPIKDFKEVLGLLELFSTVDEESGVYKLTPKDGQKSAYLKHLGAWAYLSDKAESLPTSDADPMAALKGLAKNYVIAGRIMLANVPEPLRAKVITGFKDGMAKERGQKADESDDDFAIRTKLLNQIEPYLVRVLGDLDRIDFGWGLDRSAEKTFLDLSLTAKSGTKTAAEMAASAKAQTRFAGFRAPSAVLNATVAGPIPEAKQEFLGVLIEAVRGKALSEIAKDSSVKHPELAKRAVNDLLDICSKIVKSGTVDGAATILASPKGATALAAGRVADGKALEKLLRDLVATAEKEKPEIAKHVKFDAETIRGVRIHKASIPIPADAKDRKQVVQLVGENLDVVVGFDAENAYLAVGRDAASQLKKAIEACGKAGAKATSPVDVSLSVKPIIGLVAAMGKPHERKQAAAMEAELKKAPGKDHVLLTVRPVADGVQVHLEVEQGLLRTVGRLVASPPTAEDN